MNNDQNDDDIKVRPSKPVKRKQKSPIIKHISITDEVFRTIQRLVKLANKKEYGKLITKSDILTVALDLVDEQSLEQLRVHSLRPKDKIDLAYKKYCQEHGRISRDEFLGKLYSSWSSDDD